MWGALIGDLAGSIYEYEQSKNISEVINNQELINFNSFYSDDTILTVAILDAILNDGDYEKYLKIYGNEYINYKPNFEPYFNFPFSPNFIKWLKGTYIGKSNGNGAMMRISPIGYLFDKEEDVITNAKLATIPSHDSPESIECATLIAKIIFLSRNNLKKEEIIKRLNIQLKYSPFLKFNTSCYETIDNCLYALFTSNGFEESVRKVISYGGDTDTNACIVGSMAEALYGLDNELIEIATTKLPESFVKKLHMAYKITKGV